MSKIKKEEIVNALLIIASAMVLLILRCQSRLGDSDFYWHITLGKDILTNCKIPVADSYSWLSPEYGLVETAHSWLSSVSLYLSTIPFGGEDYYGVVLFAVVTYTIFQAIVYCLFIRRIKSAIHRNAATVIAIFAGFLLYSNARPQNIGYILFVISMYLLIELYENGNIKHLVLMPLVSVCWANFHGGSVPMLFAFNAMFLDFTAQQLDYINKWTTEKYTLSDIEKAYRTTVENTKKDDPSQIPFTYLDKVLISNRKPQSKRGEQSVPKLPSAAPKAPKGKGFNGAEYEEKCALMFIYEKGLSEEYMQYMIGKDFMERYGSENE